MSSQDQDIERLKKAVADLGEHFESVQIFASRHDPEDGTTSVNWGGGNWHARRGQVAEWMRREDERTKREVQEE